MTFSKKMLPLFFFSLFLSFCSNPCSDYFELTCKDIDSPACEQLKEDVKNMKPEECKNAIDGFEAKRSMDALDNEFRKLDSD